MSDPTPQDAPRAPAAPDPGTVPTGPVARPAPTGSMWTPPPAASGAPPPLPEVRYLPRPTGPNWGLVLMGLALIVVAVAVVANQVSGFQVTQLADTGPGVLVGIGLTCALVGVVGMLRRRRH